MNDESIPKYQIREKTPDEETEVSSDKKIYKK